MLRVGLREDMGFAARCNKSNRWADANEGHPSDLLRLPPKKEEPERLVPALPLSPMMGYLRAIITSLPECDGWLATSSLVSGLGALSIMPVLPCSPQISVRKY
jgi:hypothetical protein